MEIVVDVVSNDLEGETIESEEELDIKEAVLPLLLSSVSLSVVFGWRGFGGSSTSVAKERGGLLYNIAVRVGLVTTSDCVGEYALAVGSQGQACF
mmetsp:Transcript_23880/g.43179  ORF Transcript_23880/g.43179 Transcript_23880/m.43179 type:complete len:95 (+) Transcript_23880:2394-2678(+)